MLKLIIYSLLRKQTFL